MALTNSERQANFRKRAAFKHDGQGERQLSMWVTTATACALERLAVHHKTTRRDILERLLIAEQDRIKETLSDTEYELFMDGALLVTKPMYQDQSHHST